MDKKWYEETVYLTQYVMERFYRNEFMAIFPYFHRDIVWIGAEDGQFYESRETVCKQIWALNNFPDGDLINQTYKAICPDDLFCTVAGSYKIFSAVQRLTVVWMREDASAKILHMHLSIPLAPKRQNLQAIILRFQGKDAEIYLFKPDEILYIEASNNHCLIHAITGSHIVCQPLNSIAPALTDQFHRIHRSFIVNRNHVAQIRRYKLLMSDGSALPIPEKKYSGVRLALTGV